ncbi:hypothetical protein POJ06DRAFT_60863 [Lipomyces tetrasporus]|uniref:Exonuclease 1 n=1 Tax=Lipomyces tetrasporus TaxID=54092 RepID=A0AAD7QXD2_9ASCO|nr:uncharacterized protein POJ06DRAFT_60863 [Lipomyces tetrasporus]KAJ8103006.1 hypothetical protein POJ06DRAFT_60863 [Lipomyces tetrasporus]
MGISGLLPMLKSIQQPAHVKEFAGQVIAVDAYVWLHRGAIACAADLAFGNHTRKYVDYAMHRVRMLKYYGVKPYMVFDGANLPSKQHTETDRRITREAALEAAMKLHKAGMRKEADDHFQKCIDITPTMASHLIKALESEGVPYLVAPYEADAQMVYLEKTRLVSAIISEDSDLLVFGCKRLLTKLTDYGECVSIRRERFSSCTEIDLTSFSDALFRHMAIFAGCDYTPGIPNIGLRKAHRYLRRYKSADRALKFMRLEGKITVPPTFMADFERADKTFQYQRVYCPIQMKVVMWNEPEDPLPEQLDYYIGRDIEPAVAIAIATGKLDPNTKEPIPDDSGIRSMKEDVNGTPFKQIPRAGQTITDYFRRSPNHGRHPLCDITNSAASETPPTTNSRNTTPAWAAALGRRTTPCFNKPSPEDPIAKRLRILSPSISESDGMDKPAIMHSHFFPAPSRAVHLPLANPDRHLTSEHEDIVHEEMRVVDIPAEDIAKPDAKSPDTPRLSSSDEQVNQQCDHASEQKQNTGEDQQEATQKDICESTVGTESTKSLHSDSLAMMTPPSADFRLRRSNQLPSSFFAPRRQPVLTPPDSTMKAGKSSSSSSNSFSTVSSGSSLSSCSMSDSVCSPLLERNRFLHFRAHTTSEDTMACPSTPIQRSITSFTTASYLGTPTHARRPVINSNGIGVFSHVKSKKSRQALRSMPTTLDNSQLKATMSTELHNSVRIRSENRAIYTGKVEIDEEDYEIASQPETEFDTAVSTLSASDMRNRTSFQASLHRFRNENRNC